MTLTAPPAADPPVELRRASDGRSEHDRHTAARYAAAQSLLAEGRLVETARTGGAPVVPADRINEMVARFGLGADQQAALRHVLGSGRRVDAVVGPAGTARPTPPPPSSPPGTPTEGRCSHWRRPRTPPGSWPRPPVPRPRTSASGSENGAGRAGWQVQRGQLVIVDEAAMVPTAQLDQVVGRVTSARGKVLLVGDPEQLAAPGAGGAMRLVVTDVGAAHLDEVRRFDALWEAGASLRLRAGDPDALVEYNRRARISGGTAEQAQEAAYRAWPSTAELARREEKRAARPFLDLDDEQLYSALVDARGELASIDRQRDDVVRVVSARQAEAWPYAAAKVN